MMGYRGNIALTGFMGTGKSTVGKKLARELGLKFLDIDEIIEKEAGAPISAIFKKHGEARFRSIESDVIGRLSSGSFGDGLVVSTGGGAVVNPVNRKALKGWGTLICLKASIDEIISRVGDREDRPLLAAADKRAAAEKLLAEREEAYGDADFTVDTTGMRVEEVIDKIKVFLRARA